MKSVCFSDAETGKCWQEYASLFGDVDTTENGDPPYGDPLYPNPVYGQASFYDPARKDYYVVGGTQGNTQFSSFLLIFQSNPFR